MTSAALDVIIGAWLVIYSVPSIFDKDTAGLIDMAIIMVAVLHTRTMARLKELKR